MTMNHANGSSDIIPAHVLGPIRDVDDAEDDASVEDADDRHEDSEESGSNEPAASEADGETFPSGADGRPTIDVQKPLEHVVDRSVEVLAKDPTLFNMHSELTHVIDEGDRIRTRPLVASQARIVLARGAKWVSGGRKIHPPGDIARCVVDGTAWEGIRVLRAVTPFPAMDSAGRIRTEAGYDENTNTYFTGGARIELSESPTKEDAAQAVETLLDIVQDFPFANKPSREHQAAWIAGLLTPLARYAHDGNAPLTVVQANCARAGKTTLVQVISKIVTGFDSSVVTFTKNEDETRKRIFTFLRHPRSMVLIDNVVGQFGGANLNAMLTTRSFEDRIIGQSKYLEVKADASWFVTGNNMSLAPDTAERCVHVGLQSDEENPHERTGFKYPYLYETIKERRGQLLSAALTVLKAFVVAGKPEQGLSSWGGFETWSRLVRGAVVFAGLPDPAITRAQLEQEADVEADEIGAVIAALWEWQQGAKVTVPFTVNDVLKHLQQYWEMFPQLRNSLVTLAGTAGGALPSVRVLARRFREAKNRNFGGFILRSEQRHNANLYMVERLVREIAIASDSEPAG